MQHPWIRGLFPIVVAWSSCAIAQTHDHSRHMQPSRPAAQPAEPAPAQEPARPREADAKRAPPAALKGYRPFADAEPVDWRAANEQVRAVGGHAGAMKEGPK